MRAGLSKEDYQLAQYMMDIYPFAAFMMLYYPIVVWIYAYQLWRV